jgi:predicted transcriptional regulator
MFQAIYGITQIHRSPINMISAKVSDFMNKDFAKIHPEMPVAEAASKLTKKSFYGGPVIDKSGTLLGWLSEQECLQVTLQVMYHNTRVSTVNDVMRTDVLSVKLDSDPLVIAEQILAGKPTSYPVIDDNNKVLGVLTRRHILTMLEFVRK